MGTHALTRVFENGSVILAMHRQYDGYLHGHGAELAEFLTGGPIVNGFANRDETCFNGMGCLAAALVARLKKSVGNHYISSPRTSDEGYEYVYDIYHNKVILKVLTDSGKHAEKVFDSYSEFDDYIKKYYP